LQGLNFRGHQIMVAPREYDDDQVDQIKEQIDKIRTTNAALCQLEYTATKGGPRGQGKR
jgi:hypothetical protein